MKHSVIYSPPPKIKEKWKKNFVSKFLLGHFFCPQLEKLDKTLNYFELSDENKCNWMMFVRPADNYAEQNLVVYQHGQDVFFSVTKNIEARQELKVICFM